MKNNPNSKKQNLTIANKDKEYAYVMASTLNQMINYIPLKMQWEYRFTHVYNVTLVENGSSKKLKDNANWDKNFCEVEKSLSTDIRIEQADWVNIAKVIQRFKEVLKLEKNPIFWNITGGQRPFLLAVLEFTRNRPNDRIAYLEGNNNHLITMQNTCNGLICIDPPRNYAIEGLTIEIAFKLMGFTLGGSNSGSNFLLNNEKDKNDFYTTAFYSEYKKNVTLRTKLADFNKNVTEIAKKDTTNRRANHDSVIKDLANCSTLLEPDMKKYWDKFNTRKAFGYILEELTAILILNALKKHNILSKVADMQVSTKISAEYYKDNSSIDELDILVLTKTGQLINFECKSGDMSGDNAKSNKYSTYAVSGVYGSPILISPALESEVPNGFIHDSVKSAYNSAKRANLEVWCIDEIETKIKEKLK